MRKKGTLTDIYFIATVGFLSLFLVFLVSGFMYLNFFSVLEKAPGIADSPTVKGVISGGQSFYNNLDKVSIAYFVGVALALIISSWFVSGHPIAMALYFLGGIGAVLISMMVSNLWDGITGVDVFASTLALFPFANYVMSNLAFYTGVFYFIGIIITFVKPQLQKSSGGFQGGGI